MSSEPVIRVAFFIGVFLVVAAWEALAPRRRRQLSRWKRWPANLGIVALNTALVRFLLPTTAVAFAILGEQRGWGLLNTIGLPHWLAIVLAVLALDFAIYLQHVLFHAVPVLWRLHRMHHADLDIDVTFKSDGTFTALGGASTGVWRIDGEKLCSTPNETLIEGCAVYPAGKTSGDTFELDAPGTKLSMRIR